MLNFENLRKKLRYTSYFNPCQNLFMTILNKKSLTSKLSLKAILTKQKIFQIITWSF